MLNKIDFHLIPGGTPYLRIAAANPDRYFDSVTGYANIRALRDYLTERLPRRRPRPPRATRRSR